MSSIKIERSRQQLEHSRAVRRMFSGIVPRYDLLNRLLSGGLDRSWRRRLARALAPLADGHYLDLACGTGDVARELRRQCPATQITLADPVPQMLSVARQRLPEADCAQAEAEHLPFANETFSGVTVAFGVRNFSSRTHGLAEIRRVLRPGGMLGILEFTQPGSGLANALVRIYLRLMVPLLGRLMGNADAYAYLAESIRQFPPAAEFIKALQAAGFEDIQARRLSGGVTWLYTGRKPE